MPVSFDALPKKRDRVLAITSSDTRGVALTAGGFVLTSEDQFAYAKPVRIHDAISAAAFIDKGHYLVAARRHGPPQEGRESTVEWSLKHSGREPDDTIVVDTDGGSVHTVAFREFVTVAAGRSNKEWAEWVVGREPSS
jgi:hypothetical protein